jgi:DedD protein
MVFDPEPKSTQAPVSVLIPGENEAQPFAPKPAPKPATKAEPPAQQTAAGEYVIQVGAFARPESVIAKLSSAKVPYYTEPMPDNLTRVRAGPFASREAADQALGKLKQLGLKPGPVSTKSG